MTRGSLARRAGDSHALLFASGKVTAGSPQFVAQANRFQQAGSAFAHLAIGKLPKLAHRDHHVLLRREILHQKMELKNEADELVPFMRQFVIAQLGHWLRIRLKRGRRPADRAARECRATSFCRSRTGRQRRGYSRLDIERYAAEGVHAFFLFAQIALDRLRN